MSSGDKVMTSAEKKKEPGRNIPLWFAIIVPLVAIGLML
jgi:hypothetical protein